MSQGLIIFDPSSRLETTQMTVIANYDKTIICTYR